MQSGSEHVGPRFVLAMGPLEGGRAYEALAEVQNNDAKTTIG